MAISPLAEDLEEWIQSEPYTPPASRHNTHTSSAFPKSCQHSGYLEIQNNTDSTWKKKFFMISNNFLLAAATPISLFLDQIIYLQDCTIICNSKANSQQPNVFKLLTEHNDALYLRTASDQQCALWIDAIHTASAFKIKDIYRFLYIAGTSGMTKVVAAKHRVTNEDSAIKIVDKRICDKNRLKTEIDILKTLHNEHIVSLFDVIETRRYLYIVMEMCPGGELFDQIVELDGNHYTEQDCCLIMHQIAKGVNYMHSMGIIHRDLKPENILCVQPQSVRQIKIADFGISKIFTHHTDDDDEEEDEEKGVTETRLCSICYTAPEILANRKYDYRTDYYSIGVILYILLCGYPPFCEDEFQSDQRLIDSILNDELVFDDEDWEHVSSETKDLVKGLLARDPSKRKSCDDVLKLVWKVTNSTTSFEKARENFKQHVMNCRMKKYSFSACSLASDELFDVNRKRMRKRGSMSCSALPGFPFIAQTPDSIDELSVSINFANLSSLD
eukprot:184393_1